MVVISSVCQSFGGCKMHHTSEVFYSKISYCTTAVTKKRICKLDLTWALTKSYIWWPSSEVTREVSQQELCCCWMTEWWVLWKQGATHSAGIIRTTTPGHFHDHPWIHERRQLLLTRPPSIYSGRWAVTCKTANNSALVEMAWMWDNIRGEYSGPGKYWTLQKDRFLRLWTLNGLG